ncbi:MAG: glycosyltransferase family 2 protein [Alphaproteobacteria bacterium]|nr:glycosyltransferase family 2 protein [Alphaproteobacteria bacterium]
MVKVSIIIPVYNVEPYLRQCLDSVVNQTLEDIEAICVDDCSSDNSGKILDEYAAQDSRIRVFHLEKNGGAGIARNFGLDKAQGKYIMLLDPDDWYELNACELLYKQIEKNKNDFVCYGMFLYNNKTQIIKTDTFRLQGLIPYMDDMHLNFSKLQKPFIKTTETVCRIYLKNFLDCHNIRFGDSHCGEDVIFAMKCFLFATDVSVLNVPLYYYRQNNDKSMSHNTERWRENFTNRYEVLKYMEKQAPENILKSYIIWCIRSVMSWRSKYMVTSPHLAKEIYTYMRTIFQDLNTNHNVRELKKYIDFAEFKKIVRNPYWKYYLLTLLKNLRQRVLPHKKR